MNKEQTILSSGMFEIDSNGFIWRVAKRQGRGVMKGGGYHHGAKIVPCRRVRAEYSSRQGYLCITVTIGGTKTATGAHRVVWHHANGPIPDGLTINHKDGNKSNNCVANLELATASEQRRHALDVLNVNRNRPTGSKHPKTKLSEQDVINIRQLRADGAMVRDIAEMYQMKTRAISAICTRRTWLHI